MHFQRSCTYPTCEGYPCDDSDWALDANELTGTILQYVVSPLVLEAWTFRVLGSSAVSDNWPGKMVGGWPQPALFHQAAC